MPTDGPYSIGSDSWPGLSKLIEECGEVLQEAGKIIGTGGSRVHWDRKGDLAERLAGEMGDLLAAIQFVSDRLPDQGLRDLMQDRYAEKIRRFRGWHRAGDPAPQPGWDPDRPACGHNMPIIKNPETHYDGPPPYNHTRGDSPLTPCDECAPAPDHLRDGEDLRARLARRFAESGGHGDVAGVPKTDEEKAELGRQYARRSRED